MAKEFGGNSQNLRKIEELKLPKEIPCDDGEYRRLLDNIQQLRVLGVTGGRLIDFSASNTLRITSATFAYILDQMNYLKAGSRMEETVFDPNESFDRIVNELKSLKCS